MTFDNLASLLLTAGQRTGRTELADSGCSVEAAGGTVIKENYLPSSYKVHPGETSNIRVNTPSTLVREFDNILSPNMPDFFKTSSHTQDSAQGTNARKEAVMNSIRSELALVNVQELINKATEKCFTKCVPKPGTSLTSSDEACLARCLDRYMEAFTVVSRTYTARISRESSQLRGAAAEI